MSEGRSKVEIADALWIAAEEISVDAGRLPTSARAVTMSYLRGRARQLEDEALRESARPMEDVTRTRPGEEGDLFGPDSAGSFWSLSEWELHRGRAPMRPGSTGNVVTLVLAEVKLP